MQPSETDSIHAARTGSRCTGTAYEFDTAEVACRVETLHNDCSQMQTNDTPRTPLDILKGEAGRISLRRGEPGPVSQTRLTLAGLGEESSKTLSKTMGLEGTEMARLAKAVRNEAEIEANTAATRVNDALKGLDQKQIDNLVDVLEGKARPVDEKVSTAFTSRPTRTRQSCHPGAASRPPDQKPSYRRESPFPAAGELLPAHVWQGTRRGCQRSV